jgi:hypothetical protein
VNDAPHDHRPDRAAQRAALIVCRALLTGADADAHAAAAASSCPPCTAMAGVSFGITLASMLAGDEMFVSEQTRARLLAAVDAAAQEIDTAPN